MKKLKLIISFILLVSLFLGVVACTPDEESKADVSVTTSDEVSADMSTDESEDEPDVSIDENIFRIRNQLKPYGQGEIILVDKYKGDRKLYMVTLSTSDSLIDDNKVIADAFYDKYGLTFSEAFEKYCDDPEDHEKRVEAFEKIEADVSLLLPSLKEKMLNELKSIHNVDNIILDERLIEDLADVVVTEPKMSFYSYRIQLLVYANETEVKAIEKLDATMYILAFGEHTNSIENFDGWDQSRDGVYYTLGFTLCMSEE
ncbi:MAG: hypothetical protein J6L23_00460 [Clostridia bacterium]|nr:hypothetical protein [Clostridia bacterium]